MKGTVKFFNRIKGFGFIKGEDEKDYFVHISAIEGGKFLNENDQVEFDAMEDEKGLKAQNIKILGAGEAPAEEEPAEEETSEEAPAEEEATEEETSEEAPAEEEATEEKKEE